MKRRSILGVTGALVATVAITGSAFAATLFTNGSFETGAYVQDETGYGYMTIEANTPASRCDRRLDRHRRRDRLDRQVLDGLRAAARAST